MGASSAVALVQLLSSSTAHTPASELQATVAMVARRASWGGCLFTWSCLPRPCSSLPTLPFHFLPWSSCRGLGVACGGRHPPVPSPPLPSRGAARLLFIHFAQRHPLREHTLKLTMQGVSLHPGPSDAAPGQSWG